MISLRQKFRVLTAAGFETLVDGLGVGMLGYFLGIVAWVWRWLPAGVGLVASTCALLGLFISLPRLWYLLEWTFMILACDKDEHGVAQGRPFEPARIEWQDVATVEATQEIVRLTTATGDRVHLPVAFIADDVEGFLALTKAAHIPAHVRKRLGARTEGDGP